MRGNEWSSDVCSSDLCQWLYPVSVGQDKRRKGAPRRLYKCDDRALIPSATPMGGISMTEAGRDKGGLAAHDWAGDAGARWLAQLDRFESMIEPVGQALLAQADRKSTRLNSSH